MLVPRVPSSSSPGKGLYNPKAFVTHAASLDQAFAHCPRFPTAASRRSLGRVSVPVWPAVLSDRLPITGLVGRYPANYLIGRGPVPRRPEGLCPAGIIRYQPQFPTVVPNPGVGSHALLTRPPLPEANPRPLDLHVLSAPPAFVLSQDQTLSFTLAEPTGKPQPEPPTSPLSRRTRPLEPTTPTRTRGTRPARLDARTADPSKGRRPHIPTLPDTLVQRACRGDEQPARRGHDHRRDERPYSDASDPLQDPSRREPVIARAPARHGRATGGTHAAASRAGTVSKTRPTGPALTRTVSPSLTRPSRIMTASGSWSWRWITRFKGRAP